MGRPLKILLLIAGTAFVGLGALGVFLPLLPTTPFLLLAAACYARSSEPLYAWLLNNRWFGRYIKNWREGKGIPFKTKMVSIFLLILTVGYSVVFVVPNILGKFFLILVAVSVSKHIHSLPTMEES